MDQETLGEEPRNVRSFLASIGQAWREHETTRNFVAFFFLGLSNNVGYVIMLSAAHDLLQIIDHQTHTEPTGYLRECNAESTGAILLADIIPCMVIKLIAPFLPLRIQLRMVIVVVAAALGIIFVALGISKVCIILGICLISFSQGFGESTILAYTVFFRTKNVLATWSSGTGLAGLLCSFAYSFMIQLGLSPQTTIYTMLCMPLTMAVCFWVVMEKPMLIRYEHDRADLEMLRVEDERQKREIHLKRLSVGERVEPPKSTMMENVKTIPKIFLTYTLWYGLVYFFEYFINQGLFELIYIPNSLIDHAAQYRWYNTLYQFGVFLSRSSMTVVQIDQTYLTALFQGVNVAIFLMEAMYGYITFLPIALAIIFWEGLLGGACYVNTYRRIATEWPQEGKEFAMSINSIGDSVMVSIAGALALPVHDAICRTNPTYGKPIYSAPPTTVFP